MVFTRIPNRRHENAASMLAGFSGLLYSDGYAAHTNLAQSRPELILLACWSHVLRGARPNENLTRSRDFQRLFSGIRCASYPLRFFSIE